MNKNQKYLIKEIKKVEKEISNNPSDIENIIYLEELKSDLSLVDFWDIEDDRIGF